MFNVLRGERVDKRGIFPRCDFFKGSAAMSTTVGGVFNVLYGRRLDKREDLSLAKVANFISRSCFRFHEDGRSNVKRGGSAGCKKRGAGCERHDGRFGEN